MQNRVKVIFCSLVVGLGALPAGAQLAPKVSRVSLNAGAAFPTSANDFSDSAKTGPTIGGQYLYQLTSHLGVGGQVDYLHFPYKQHRLRVGSSNLNTRSTDNALTFEAVTRYTLLVENRFSPYLQGGVGLARFHRKFVGDPAGSSTWANTGTREERTISQDTSTNVSFSFTGGIETALRPFLYLGLEGTWHILGVSHDKFGTDFINVPGVALRLSWQFGG